MALKRDVQSYKIIILGESYVGKTSIARKFVNDEFETSLFSTIGIDLLKKTVKLHNRDVKLDIWDTAGQERFHSITKSYYRSADGIILVFDLLDPKSFDCIDRWFESIFSEADKNVPIFLVGNKYDETENKKDFEMSIFEEKAKSMGVDFYATSAKTGHNIELMFVNMAENLSRFDNFLTSPVDDIKFDEEIKKKGKRWKKCC